MLSLILLFVLRSKNKKIKALLNNKGGEEGSDSGSIELYLTAESKLTKGRFDLFYQNDDLISEVFTEPDWLILRKNYLEMEKELLASTEREDGFWLELGHKFKKIMSDSLLVKRLKVKNLEDGDEDEIKELKTLLKSQHDEFDELALELEGDKSAAEVAALKEKLTSIVRSHTELSHCLYMLEDENMFLRDQIKSLLD